MTAWAQRRDELNRTVFAGQTLLDGGEVEVTTVAPQAHVEPESADAGSGDEAVDAGSQSVLFGD